MSNGVGKNNVTQTLRGVVIDTLHHCNLLGVTKNRNDVMAKPTV